MSNTKNIDLPVDIPGRKVYFRPHPKSDILQGEVFRVRYQSGPDKRYPKGSKGYENGIRALYKKISIVIPDGRVFVVSGEEEDLEEIGMIPVKDSKD